MRFDDFADNQEEIFVGAMLQFPLIFIIGWWVLPVMALCGILWRIGGTKGGSKMARRIGVPFVVLLSSALVLHEYMLFLALPFMIWACPFSYGKESWLFNFIMIRVHNQQKADFLTRTALFAWYWGIYSIAISL